MNVDFSKEILALEVDKIYFENTKKEYSKQAEDDYKVLSIDFTKVPMISPFKNSSLETKKELEKISVLQNQWNPSKELLMRCDDDPDGVVFDFYDKVNPPIKSNPVDRHITIGELMEETKKLKDWTPDMGMGENLKKITTSYKGGKHSYMTRLENYLNSSLGPYPLRDKITLTPPKEIASTAKIDTWLSLLAILKNKNPRMFKEILNLIKAKRMGLKTGGIV